MAITQGPSVDGKKFVFLADNVTFNGMRGQIPLNNGKEGAERVNYYNKKSDTVEKTHFLLPYETQEEVKFVEGLLENYKVAAEKLKVVAKENLPAAREEFRKTYPYSFTGEEKRNGGFFKAMGAEGKYVADEFMGWVFDAKKDVANTEKGWASAEDRYNTARETLELGLDIMDPNARNARKELNDLGAASVKRGDGKNTIEGWVIAPPPTLDPTVWGEQIAKAQEVAIKAGIRSGPAKDFQDVQLLLLIEAGLSEQSFGFKATNYSDIAEYVNDRHSAYSAVYKGQRAYAKLIAENTDKQGNIEPGVGIMGDDGKIFKTLGQAAAAAVGKERGEATLGDVVSQTAQQQIEVTAKREKPSSLVYAIDNEISDLTNQIMHRNDDFTQTAQNIAGIKEALGDNVKLKPLIVEEPFVIVGPIVAVTKHYVFQEYLGQKNGIPTFEYAKHDRALFLGKTGDESISLGHLISDITREAAILQAIEAKSPIAIGSHAGVNVALSLTKFKESLLTQEDNTEIALAEGHAQNTGTTFDKAAAIKERAEKIYETLSHSTIKLQNKLNTCIMTECQNAKISTIKSVIAAHNTQYNLRPTRVSPKEDASLEDFAEYEVKVEADTQFNEIRSTQLEKEKREGLTITLAVIEEKRQAAITQINQERNAPALSDARSLPVAAHGTARLPEEIKEIRLIEEIEPMIGQIVDYRRNLIVIDKVKSQYNQQTKETTFTKTGELYLANSYDSKDMFNYGLSNGNIARAYLENEVIITVGVSEGSLVVLKGNYNVGNQLGIDEAKKKFETTTKAELILKKEKTQDDKSLKGRYDPDVNRVIGNYESEKREERNALLNKVARLIAEERNIDLTKILVEKQYKKDVETYTERQALNAAGIYAVSASVSKNSKSGTREGMTTIDFGNLEWRKAKINAIEKNVTVISAYDNGTKTIRVAALDDLLTESFYVRGSEEVSGISVYRKLKVNDEIEFTAVKDDVKALPTTRNVDGANYKIEIISERITDLNNQDEINRRADKVLKTNEMQQIIEEAVRKTLSEPYKYKSAINLPTDREETCEGYVYVTNFKGRSVVSVVRNATDYMKSGELRYTTINPKSIDSSQISYLTSPNARGIKREGGYGKIELRDGKVVEIEVLPLQDYVMEVNAKAALSALEDAQDHTNNDEDIETMENASGNTTKITNGR